MYACFIDSTKAFDRVRHDKLFEVLKDRGMPALIIRMMLDLYQRQSVKAAWKGHDSSLFGTTNGIRQGGVISPVLYCVYVDVLLNALEKGGVGCRVGRHYFGAVGYADDLTLCAPSASGLRKMIEICEDFGKEFSVKYNPTKTVCVLFTNDNNIQKPLIRIDGIELSWVDEVKHLGNYLHYRLCESKEINAKKGDLIQRVNTVLASVGSSDIRIMRKVFNTQCAHFYGAEAWRFTDKSVSGFQTAWNRCVRRLLHLPLRTHRKYLPELIASPTALNQIYARFAKMLTKMESSDNERIAFLTRMCKQDQRTIIGSNIRTIANVLQVQDNEVLENYLNLKKFESDCDSLNLILELLDFTNGDVFIDGFTYNEIDFMLNFLCTE